MPFALSSENSISSCVSTLSNSGLLLETITFSSSERPLYPPLANPLTGRGFVLVLCLRMASKARIWFMETGSCNCHAGVTYSFRCTGPATSKVSPYPVNPPSYQPAVFPEATRAPVPELPEGLLSTVMFMTFLRSALAVAICAAPVAVSMTAVIAPAMGPIWAKACMMATAVFAMISDTLMANWTPAYFFCTSSFFASFSFSSRATSSVLSPARCISTSYLASMFASSASWRAEMAPENKSL